MNPPAAVSVSPRAGTCKICAGRTRPFADIQANRTCEDEKRPVFEPSPRLIAYRRCTACGLIATTDFDRLTDAELAAEIYNADYVRADPDFAGRRPFYKAAQYGPLLHRLPISIRGLDYGGGNGMFARLMGEHGVHFDSYDPYLGDTTAPTGQYDIITAFEVIEHSRTPMQTLADILAHLKPDGVLLFATSIQPRGVTPDWAYIAPRNGHVSLHSAASLRKMAKAAGTRLLSLSDHVHIIFHPQHPATAAALMHAWPLDDVLYNASMRGPAHLLRVILVLRALGAERSPGLPRHMLRSLLHIGA